MTLEPWDSLEEPSVEFDKFRMIRVDFKEEKFGVGREESHTSQAIDEASFDTHNIELSHSRQDNLTY